MNDPEYEAVRAACSTPARTITEHELGRRTFMKGALAVTGGILLAPWLSRLEAFAAPPIAANEGVLVCIMLGGGNDGLHTLIPYANGDYRRLRGALALSEQQVLRINAQVGLHPALNFVKSMYDENKVGIVQGVGFANQDGSHFTSMATWMQGWSGTASGARGTGWLGRFLDGLPNAAAEPLRGVTFGTSVPLHLSGINAPVSALPLDGGMFFGTNPTRAFDARLYQSLGSITGTELGALANTYATSMRDTIALPTRLGGVYDQLSEPWGIERQCQLAARLINANLGIRVITCELESFDFHTDLMKSQNEMLSRLDSALRTLFTTIEPKFRNRLCVTTFSEFGRRPAANGSGGTDHGTASVQLVLGDRVKGGLFGAQPSLAGLSQSSDPVPTVDFRQVFGDIAQTWLRADPKAVVGANTTPLGLFRGGPTA